MQYKLINTQDELNSYLPHIEMAEYIAIDTEFNRDHKYYPNLSLLQICYKSGFAIVIDTLSRIDLTKLFQIIYNPKIIKIFHSCHQDLEIFYYKNGAIPQNLFDTQIASLLLYNIKEISYEKLVLSLLNIKIDKKLQTSNWELRPLSKSQIKYAALDVLYLYDAYVILLEKLKNHSLFYILSNIFKTLENTKRYDPNIEQQQNKLFLDHHTSAQKYLISNLINWREEKALNFNISRNMVLKNHNIKEIAMLKDINIDSLCNILDYSIATDYLEEIQQIFTSSINIESPYHNDDKTLTQNAIDIYHILKIIVDIVAKKNNINEHLMTSFIINQADLKHIAKTYNTSILNDWRYDLIGKDIQDFLDGKVSVSMLKKEATLS